MLTDSSIPDSALHVPSDLASSKLTTTVPPKSISVNLGSANLASQNSTSQGLDPQASGVEFQSVQAGSLNVKDRVSSITSSQLSNTDIAERALLEAKIKKAWGAAIAHINRDVDPQVFAAYIRPLKLVGFERADLSGQARYELLVTAPSKLVCNHVGDKFGSKLAALIIESLGLAVDVRFVVSSANPQAEEPAVNLNISGDTQLSKTAAQDSSFQNTTPNEAPTRIVVKKVRSAPAKSSVSLKSTSSPSDYANINVPSVLSSKYTFDTFVVGDSNQFCHAAAQRVAEQPGLSYNPLFIYGGVGLGKTHLLHAIGNLVLKRKPNTRVLYLSSETLMNEFIHALRTDQMAQLKRTLRNIELLLIDDIQFISGKEKTQEEFFHTFNALYNSKHQLVITSDKIPQDISGIEERLRTRFSWGLTVDLQAPDFETRVAILNHRAAAASFELPTDVAHYIAEKVKSNVRELEGALTRLHAMSSLRHLPINLEMAQTALRPLLQTKVVLVSSDDIKKSVATYFSIRVSDMISKRRTRNLSFPRHVAMYLCRKHTTCSYPEIGMDFGGRDHSSVIHATSVVADKIAADGNVRNMVSEIERRILGS